LVQRLQGIGCRMNRPYQISKGFIMCLLSSMSNGQLVLFIEDNADSLDPVMSQLAVIAEEMLLDREERENANIA